MVNILKNKKNSLKSRIVMLFLIMSFLFSFSLMIAFLQNETYFVGEKIKIDLRNVEDFEARVIGPVETYFIEGDREVVFFVPEYSGRYDIKIFSSEEMEDYYFNVLDKGENVEEYFEKEEENISDFIEIGQRVLHKKIVNASNFKKGIDVSGFEDLSIYQIESNTRKDVDNFSFVRSINGNSIILENVDGEVELEYYTKGPEKREKIIDAKKKQVTIDSEFHYENILAYTEIEEVLKLEQKDAIKIYWQEEGVFMDFKVFDENENGLIDKVEWIVPHLSEQNFEIIIEITRAEHLGVDKEFIEDVYEDVRMQDDIWTGAVSDGEYVRVVFEKNLTRDNDITIYPRTVSGSPRIEVYEKDGEEVIAEFSNIFDYDFNKVFLSGLKGGQDSFDLKIVGGSLEFDYIVDPSFQDLVILIYSENYGSTIDSGISLNFENELKKDSIYVHNTTLNNQSVYIGEDGWYKVSYGCHATETGASDRAILEGWLRVNGAQSLEPSKSSTYLRQTGDDGDRASVQAVTLLNLSAGDFIDFYFQEDDGSGSGHQTTEDCWMYIQKMGRDVAIIKDRTGGEFLTTTPSILNLDTEIYNSDNNSFIVDVTNDRIYANQTGWYKIYVSMTSYKASGGTSGPDRMNPAFYVRKNGVELIPSQSYCYLRGSGAGADTCSSPVFLLINLTQGDFIDVYKYLKEDGGDAIKPQTVANESWLMIEYLDSENVLSLYDSLGGDVLLSGATSSVVFDTIYHEGSDYSYSVDSNNIYFNEEGFYEVSYQFGWDDLDNGGRHTFCSWIDKNGVSLPYTRQCGYSRGATGGRYGSVAGTFIVNNSVGDYYELRHYVLGGNAEKEPNSVWFSAYPLVIAPKNSPDIAIVYPVSQSYKYVLSELNYSVSSLGEISTCWYSIDKGVTNYSTICGDNITGLTSFEGVNTWTIYSNDSFNQESNSSVIFIQDTVYPVSYGLNSSDSNPSVSDEVSFWVFWNESNNLSAWIFSWNATGVWENISFGSFSGKNNISNLTIVIPGVAADKKVGYKFYANDSSNNINVSLIGFIDVQAPPDVVSPEINFWNVSLETNGYGEDFEIIANITDNVAVYNARVNLGYPNGTRVWLDLSEEVLGGQIWKVNFSDSWQWGDYDFYIWANDTKGNTNDSSINPDYFYVRADLKINASTDKYDYYANEDVFLSSEYWWNYSWKYKMPLNLANSYGVLEEYQIKISLDTVSLYDQGKISEDCRDIRFTWNNGSSEEKIDYFVETCNVTSANSSFWIKIPELILGSSMAYVYYGNPNVSSESNINATFSYSEPRLVGYVLSEKMDDSSGGLISLNAENIIKVGPETYNIGYGETSSVSLSNLYQGSNISAKSLFNLENNANAVDMPSPISWAGTEFYYYSDRGANQFSILSPFENATIRIYDNGIEINNSPFYFNKSEIRTISEDITDDSVVRIFSDVPVLVEHHAGNSDAYPFYPASEGLLYGVPSQIFDVGSGPDGSNIDWYVSDGSSNSHLLSANQGYSLTGLGVSGDAPAYAIEGSKGIGVHQQADHDGSESVTFLPLEELGTIYGSFYATEYVAVAAPFENTNCSIYNSAGGFVDSQISTGSSDVVHKICFGCGSDTQYLTGGWKMICDKPVYAYHEEDDTGDEHNIWSWKQMRQYVYPEPAYSLGEERVVSIIENNKNFSTKFYLIIEIQENSTGVWNTVSVPVNDTNSSYNSVGPSGVLDLPSITDVIWNTETNGLGDYRALISLTNINGNLLLDDYGEYLNFSVFFKIQDFVLPVVNLSYPEKYENFSELIVYQFNFSVKEDSVDSCELWGNWTGWHLEQIIQNPMSDVEINFSRVNFSNSGYYVWSVKCNDTSGNIAWSENRTFALFLYPESPSEISITQSKNNGAGDVVLFWNASGDSVKYLIYYSDNMTSFNLLNETSDLNYTDTSFLGNIRRFYRIDSWNPAGQNSSLDYFGAHVYTLRHNGSTRNHIGFPTNFSYLTKANHSLNEIINATAFTKWDEINQRRVTCNSFSCPQDFECTDTNCNFDIEVGKSYEVNVNGSSPDEFNWSGVGVINKRVNISLVKNFTSYGKNWISMYSGTSLIKAQNIIGNITNADAVSFWNSEMQTSQGLIPSPFPWIPFLGNNFDIDIENGYEISVIANQTWRQI